MKEVTKAKQVLLIALIGSIIFIGITSQVFAEAEVTYSFVLKWGERGSGNGQFNTPYGLAVDSTTGVVYVADQGNHCVQKFTSDGNFIAKWGTAGEEDGELYFPLAVAVDTGGNVYVADHDNRIQKFSSDGAFLLGWKINVPPKGNIYGIAVDSDDHVYVADQGNHLVKKYTSDGVFDKSWDVILPSLGTYIGTPGYLAVDSEDKVYVSDVNSHRVIKYTSDGAPIASWGGYGDVEGKFRYPVGIAFDSEGNVFVGDDMNCRVQKFTSDGTYITKWGERGEGDGQFIAPNGIAVDSEDNVYVVDPSRNLVQKFEESTSNNNAPTADAGDDQTARPGDTILLDGSGSYDDNTVSQSLLYSWSFFSVPSESSATLTSPNSATPSFVPDLAGTYVLKLIVTDEGMLSSDPDEVVISSDNMAPTASAGDDQLVNIGTIVNLDGYSSTDPEKDSLTYAWTITAMPAGSQTFLNAANTAEPTMVPDIEGLYEVTLEVSDFIGPGINDTVAITAATAENFAIIQIVDADDNIIDVLEADQVTTKGNQNALINFLSQAVIALQSDDVTEAINKLEKSILRTDGCVLRGFPDGKGPGRDWIIDCEEQTVLYNQLNEALNALQN